MNSMPTIMTLGFSSYENAATRLALPLAPGVNEPCKLAALAAENQLARESASAPPGRLRSVPLPAEPLTRVPVPLVLTASGATSACASENGSGAETSAPAPAHR